MGLRGPPPKFATLRALEGSRVRSSNHKGRAAPKGAPARPRRMPRRVAQAWDELVEHLAVLRVLSTVDANILELCACSIAEHRQLTAKLDRVGMTYRTTTAQGSVLVRTRPEVALRADAHRRIQSCLAKLGLTPADRSRVQESDVPAPTADPHAWEEDRCEAWLREQSRHPRDVARRSIERPRGRPRSARRPRAAPLAPPPADVDQDLSKAGA